MTRAHLLHHNSNRNILINEGLQEVFKVDL
jgi:hypothetical protein